MFALVHLSLPVFTLMCSLGAAIAFCANLFYFRHPRVHVAEEAPSLSVLIPARNEEHSVVAAVESVLASQAVSLEVVVLDDDSHDNTAALVSAIALRDPRVRLVSSSVLPAGWNGKQFACHTLASLARSPWMCFLDADVRVKPAALHALLAYAAEHHLDLVSGFPEQETGTWLEKLLIPLIHLVLLCYLPLPGMRLFPTVPALAAGCGQIMLVRASAYASCGGHAAIRTTMHDGLLLPRLLRQCNFRTDLLDLTRLVRCRMYRNASEVWCGLSKNATEGLAAPSRIVPFTVTFLRAGGAGSLARVCKRGAHAALLACRCHPLRLRHTAGGDAAVSPEPAWRAAAPCGSCIAAGAAMVVAAAESAGTTGCVEAARLRYVLTFGRSRSGVAAPGVPALQCRLAGTQHAGDDHQRALFDLGIHAAQVFAHDPERDHL